MDSFVFNKEKGLKLLAQSNHVLHCHHYNARLQNSMENNEQVDGHKIIKDGARKTFNRMFMRGLCNKEESEKQEIVSELYRVLGFGRLNFSSLLENRVTSDSSHFVEGWRCGSIKKEGEVCVFTEGYIQAALKYLTGKSYEVKEIQCMNSGNSECVFEISELDSELEFDFDVKIVERVEQKTVVKEAESNVDSQKIIDAMMGMPIVGNEKGLIPAFNVYLANTPQDFYNYICISFVKEMAKSNLEDLAKDMLSEDAEYCALNTFAGILQSAEWQGLIQPMIKEETDIVFGLIAVANGLGWGKLVVTEHTARKSLKIASRYSYEGYGYLEQVGISKGSVCYMMKGVCSGLMELIYEGGEFDDRFGIYETQEEQCTSQGKDCCLFDVERA